MQCRYILSQEAAQDILFRNRLLKYLNITPEITNEEITEWTEFSEKLTGMNLDSIRKNIEFYDDIT